MIESVQFAKSYDMMLFTLTNELTKSSFMMVCICLHSIGRLSSLSFTYNKNTKTLESIFSVYKQRLTEFFYACHNRDSLTLNLEDQSGS